MTLLQLKDKVSINLILDYAKQLFINLLEVNLEDMKYHHVYHMYITEILNNIIDDKMILAKRTKTVPIYKIYDDTANIYISLVNIKCKIIFNEVKNMVYSELNDLYQNNRSNYILLELLDNILSNNIVLEFSKSFIEKPISLSHLNYNYTQEDINVLTYGLLNIN